MVVQPLAAHCCTPQAAMQPLHLAAPQTTHCSRDVSLARPHTPARIAEECSQPCYIAAAEGRRWLDAEISYTEGRQLTDTFTVNGAQELTLPLLGLVPLRGVLRSELETADALDWRH